MWTGFMDMHSGGDSKEQWEYIYIEAPQNEAEIIFYNRFGHNPNRVTCTCCHEDYKTSENESLAQLTGYQRGCRCLETPTEPKTRRYTELESGPMATYFNEHRYLENGEEPEFGFKISSSWRPHHKYRTLAEYSTDKAVLIIPASEIGPTEREGELPVQGYVWKD